MKKGLIIAKRQAGLLSNSEIPPKCDFALCPSDLSAKASATVEALCEGGLCPETKTVNPHTKDFGVGVKMWGVKYGGCKEILYFV